MADGSDHCGTATCPVRKLAQVEPEATFPFDTRIVAASLTTAPTRRLPVSETEPLDASQLDLESMRRIDVVCRRSEAAWRAGARPPFDSYLAEARDQGRPALRAKLEAMERELRQPRETVTRREPGSAAEVSALTLAKPPKLAAQGLAGLSVHEEAATAPSDEVTVNLGSPRRRKPVLASRTPSATSVITRSSARSPAAEWALCFRPGR